MHELWAACGKSTMVHTARQPHLLRRAQGRRHAQRRGTHGLHPQVHVCVLTLTEMLSFAAVLAARSQEAGRQCVAGGGQAVASHMARAPFTPFCLHNFFPTCVFFYRRQMLCRVSNKKTLGKDDFAGRSPTESCLPSAFPSLLRASSNSQSARFQ